MNEKQSLKENVRHGTSGQPLTSIHFISGPGTFYPDHFFVQRHWHYPVEILKIRKGTFHVEVNLESYTLHPGDICFINSEELHYLEGNQSETVHDAVIFHPHILEFTYPDEFQEQFAAPFLSHATSLPRLLTPEDPLYSIISGLFDRAAKIAQADTEGWYFRAKLLILEIFYELCIHKKMPAAEDLLSAAGKERTDRYKKMVSYIEKNYMNKITLEELAAEVQVNSQYLCHFFREAAGISPIQYLIRFRIEKACEALRDTTRPILEISLDCGFENVSYFIRQFRKFTGQTPRQYRQSLQDFSSGGQKLLSVVPSGNADIPHH